MSWLKRNLFVVIGSVITLALLGVAGYFLYTQYDSESAVSVELNDTIDKFRKLMQRKPSATEDNIKAAQEEQKRLDALLADTRKHFMSVSTLTNIDSAAFKALLETTINDLNEVAQAQGVQLPQKNFSYSFQSQRVNMVFDAPDLLPWTYQLLEVKALCESVFQGRVHKLVSVRRVAMSKKSDTGAAILASRKAGTNTVVGAVITPYEISFNGFTSELGAVLDALLKSPHCFVVKNINVTKASESVASGEEGTPGDESGVAPSPSDPYSRYGLPPGTAPGAPAPSSQELMRRRYGLRGGGPYRGGPAAGAAPEQPVLAPVIAGGGVRRGPETVLSERLLRFTVTVDAVRLQDLTAVKPAASRAAAPAPAAEPTAETPAAN